MSAISNKKLIVALDHNPTCTHPPATTRRASPESMMRDVSKPLEEALNTVQGIKEISSTSLQGVSLVRLMFNLGVDVSTDSLRLTKSTPR